MTTDFVYSKRDDGFYRIGNNKVKDGNGFNGVCSSSITIKSDYNNIKIIEIGIYAFRGTTNLQSVILSQNIQIINNFAFDKCSLRSIEFPKTPM